MIQNVGPPECFATLGGLGIGVNGPRATMGSRPWESPRASSHGAYGPTALPAAEAKEVSLGLFGGPAQGGLGL